MGALLRWWRELHRKAGYGYMKGRVSPRLEAYMQAHREKQREQRAGLSLEERMYPEGTWVVVPDETTGPGDAPPCLACDGHGHGDPPTGRSKRYETCKACGGTGNVEVLRLGIDGRAARRGAEAVSRALAEIAEAAQAARDRIRGHIQAHGNPLAALTSEEIRAARDSDLPEIIGRLVNVDQRGEAA